MMIDAKQIQIKIVSLKKVMVSLLNEMVYFFKKTPLKVELWL